MTGRRSIENMNFFSKVNHYATVACQRLERIGAGGKRSARRPQVDEVESARKQIFQASLFGNTLREVLQLQASRWPNRRLPWPQVELSQQVLRLQGLSTEGKFTIQVFFISVLEVIKIVYFMNTVKVILQGKRNYLFITVNVGHNTCTEKTRTKKKKNFFPHQL